MAGYFDDEANVAAFEKRRKEWVAAHEDAASLLASKDARIAELERIIRECAEALGNGARLAPGVSIEFMALLPGEIALCVKRRADAAETSALTAKRDGMIEAADEAARLGAHGIATAIRTRAASP